MAKPAGKDKKMIPDWTKLHKELLQIISGKMNCFDVVHARSVSTLWRSTFSFPPSLLCSSYSLPTYPVEKQGLCSLQKIPFVLVIVPALTDDVDESSSECFMGLVGRDESADYMEVPSPLQCSLRVKMAKSDPTLMNMIGSQILSLGHQERGEGRGEFVVLPSFLGTLFVLTSAKRKWVRLRGVPSSPCTALVTFRGRFYASFLGKDIYVIHPYSLVAVRLIRPNFIEGSNHLITAGADELFLVKKSTPNTGPVTCRVSRQANQLPDGCGVTGNSILFPKRAGDETYFYEYGLPEVPKENVVAEWRSSRERRVKFLDSQGAYAFCVEFEF
ncbi:unnamed protein product [Eruca vesicaria subsp. sativa]|uniref:DUF295 domain-containing protein n=1 Tax=Eruca vesicaria subsp. sativa TaxID=29727 RepID=A0ABC8JXE8_ERUVS|nr:unnamed protein product [Eruca vesicaria subsp. sativa]